MSQVGYPKGVSEVNKVNMRWEKMSEASEVG